MSKYASESMTPSIRIVVRMDGDSSRYTPRYLASLIPDGCQVHCTKMESTFLVVTRSDFLAECVYALRCAHRISEIIYVNPAGFVQTEWGRDPS